MLRFAVYGTITNGRGIRKYFSKNVLDDALQRTLEGLVHQNYWGYHE